MDTIKNYRDYILLFVLAIGLYVNTLPHGYVLDDKIAITENQFTKQGFSGIPDILTTDAFVGFYGKEKNLVAGKRYRPLSIVTFAVEYQIFGRSPFVSHLINVLLYAFTCLLLYHLMKRMFPDRRGNVWYLTTPFIIAVIFVVHPLHTEAVANIKGRDELLALLASLGALYYSLKWLDTNKVKSLLLSAACLFAGLFAKENTITFLLIIPATVRFCTDHSLKRNITSFSVLFFATVVYLGFRIYLLGIPDGTEAKELMNNPFLNASVSDKYATIFYTLGIYLKLLAYPHPLTHDYYPNQIPIIGWMDYRALVPLALYIYMTVLAFIGFKTKKPTFYAFLFYLATLSIVSNIVFPIGSFMNERFMYMPSIGYCIALGIAVTFGIYKHIPSTKINQYLINTAFLLLLIGYSIKTIHRNTAWESDFSLATTDVIVSSNSAKANMSAGLSLIDAAKEEKNANKKQNLLIQSVGYLKKSLEIYPTYIQPMLLMGNALFELGDLKNSSLYFENCLRINPKYTYALNNLEHVADVSSKNKDYQLAIECFDKLLAYKADNVRVLLKLGQLYGRDLRNNDLALKYILEANKLEPENVEILSKLGIVYSMMGNSASSINTFNNVLQLEPQNANAMFNLGVTYLGLGRSIEGEQLIQRAIELDPSLKK